MKTFNIQLSTPNTEAKPQRGRLGRLGRWTLDVECWMFPTFAGKITHPLATALAALILFFAANVKAETTNGLSAAEIQGRQLAQQLCEAQPTGNSTNTGVLQIRDDYGNRTSIFIRIKTTLGETNWSNHFQTFGESTAESNIIQKVFQMNIGYTNDAWKTFALTVAHKAGLPNKYYYFYEVVTNGHADSDFTRLNANKAMIPFAGSDFWLCDLGLEFLHWPDQKVLPKTTNLKRGRSYTLLESTNPNPSTNGYSRVLSWIDKETGGILEAEAYDAQGKLLKDFEPKSFKKVNGQWELQEMQIENVQTGSRTRLEFDLKK